ncbi:MAG: hypothetical protein HY240_06490 [Actinobacteria bacterium]|nr:hypothetical protein [Actinomycetota bacterium]
MATFPGIRRATASATEIGGNGTRSHRVCTTADASSPAAAPVSPAAAPAREAERSPPSVSESTRLR